MENDDIDKTNIKNQLEELKEFASGFKAEDISNGSWFIQLLRYSLELYSKKVNAEYFLEKYPSLPADVIAARRIDLAKKYAGIEGAISGGAYSVAVVTTIGSGGGSSPITLPAAVLAFTADLFYVTKLQLQLAYDLSILYKHPINIEDPEDVYDLIRVAFGIKAGEVFRSGLSKLAPEAVRVGIKSVIKKSALTTLKTLPVVGKYLLQKNIIKFAVPVVTVPISCLINRYTTGSTGNMARQIYRQKAGIRELAGEIIATVEDDPLLLLKVALLILKADSDPAAGGTWFLKALIQELLMKEDYHSALTEFEEIINLDVEELFAEIRTIRQEYKSLLYETAMEMAGIDQKFHPRKLEILKQLSDACNAKYDEKKVRELGEKWN